MESWENIKIEIEERKIHEASRLADDAMKMLYALDRSGKVLGLFVRKLTNISRLPAYGISRENQFYVVTKAEYEKLKGNKDMKCVRQVIDDKAFEKNYNIEWYLGNGKIQTTSAVMTSIENSYIFFRYPSGGIFMVKDEAIRSLECLE